MALKNLRQNLVSRRMIQYNFLTFVFNRLYSIIYFRVFKQYNVVCSQYLRYHSSFVTKLIQQIVDTIYHHTFLSRWWFENFHYFIVCC